MGKIGQIGRGLDERLEATEVKTKLIESILRREHFLACSRDSRALSEHELNNIVGIEKVGWLR